jgi:ribosome-binding factor A
MANNFRQQHLQSQIQNILNHTLIREIYDQSLKKASFTAVKLSPDWSIAWVYIDTFDRSQIENLLKKLTIAKGTFMFQIAKHLKIRKVPELRFIRDASIDNSRRVEEILDKIE